MNICLSNCIDNCREPLIEFFNAIEKSENADGEIKDRAQAAENLYGNNLNPVYAIEILNDCLRLIFEAKPEELQAQVTSLRKMCCIDEHPLRDFKTVGVIHEK